MNRKARRARFVCIVLAAGIFAGCKGLFGSQGLPHDPMFLDRSPVEVKAHYEPPVMLAYSEPVPPANPFLAKRPSGPVQGTLTNRPRIDQPKDEQDER